jgi:hypothetical protein
VQDSQISFDQRRHELCSSRRYSLPRSVCASYRLVAALTLLFSYSGVGATTAPWRIEEAHTLVGFNMVQLVQEGSVHGRFANLP